MVIMLSLRGPCTPSSRASGQGYTHASDEDQPEDSALPPEEPSAVGELAHYRAPAEESVGEMGDPPWLGGGPTGRLGQCGHGCGAAGSDSVAT